MNRTVWRSQLAVLALIGLAGGGLMAAPPTINAAVRAAVRDALAPGQRGLAAIAGLARDACRRMRAEEQRSLATARQDAALWRARCLALQAQHAELLDRMAANASSELAG